MTGPPDDDSADRVDGELPDDAPPEIDRGSPGDRRAVADGGFGDESGAANEPRISFYGGKWASTVPIAFFILWAIVQSGVLGIGDTNGLVIGALVGTILGMFLVRGDWKTYADTIFEGMTQRVAATAIVAWPRRS